MKVIKEIVKIAELVNKINKLSAKLEIKEELDLSIDDLNLTDSYFINGCEERNGHLYHGASRLDNSGLVDDLYYTWQKAGYCEDDFYGTLYFKTDVPGQFVAVPFQM